MHAKIAVLGVDPYDLGLGQGSQPEGVGPCAAGVESEEVDLDPGETDLVG